MSNLNTVHVETDEEVTSSIQQQLGNTLWSIADHLPGTTNANAFRDYMLSFRRTDQPTL